MFRSICLLAACTIGILAFTQPSSAQEPTAAYRIFLPVVVHPGSTGLSAEEQMVLDAVNSARALRAASGESCPPLTISPELEQAARAHSSDMAQRNFFSHTNPDGVGPFDRARAAGYTGNRMAENIAAGYPTPADAVEGWLNSPGHRANMLNCALTETGIGFTYDSSDGGNVLQGTNVGGPYFFYWTQLFGTP